MRTRTILSFIFAGVLSSWLPASVVNECNNSVCYVKKVVVRSFIQCPDYGYQTTFTCEHYLNPGECFSLIDGVEGGNCYHYYSIESVTWIPICGIVGSISGLPDTICANEIVNVTANATGGPLLQGVAWGGDALVLNQSANNATVRFPNGGTNRRILAQAAQGQATPAQATTQAIDIEVLEGSTLKSAGDIVRIDATAVMPALKARLKNASGMPGTVEWKATIVFDRPNRNDTNAFTKTLAATATWDIAAEFGSNFYGGTVTVEGKHTAASGATSQSCNPFVIHIRGLNPTVQVLETYIGTTPWYATPICRHERAGDLQFNVGGQEGPNFLTTDLKNTPNRGGDQIGWGAFQLTYLFANGRVPTTTEVWSWKANVDTGKAHLTTTCHSEAAAWIASQEQQQQNEEPTMPLQNYIFVFNGTPFQKGTARTPVDACAIQRNNGATSWVIYWKNKTTTTPGSWEYVPAQTGYVDAVCGRIAN